MTLRQTVLLLVLGVSLGAQEAIAPAVDGEWLNALRNQRILADQVVAARLDAVKKLPEFKAYEEAVKQRNDIAASVDKLVTARAPGYVLDVKTGALVKAPAQQAAAKK